MPRWLIWLLDVPAHDEDTRRRGQILIWLSLGFVVIRLMNSVVLIGQRIPIQDFTSLISAVIGDIVAIWLARRGRGVAGGWLFVSVALAGVVGTRLGMTESTIAGTVFMILPVLMASATLPMRSIVGVTALCLAGLFGGAYAGPPIDASVSGQLLVSMTAMIVLAGLIGSINTRSTQRAMRLISAAQQALAVANSDLFQTNISLEARVAERTADLAQALAESERRAEEQRELLDTLAHQREVIREMSVPVLPIGTTTLVMPLVGALDAQRLADIESQALASVERSGAHYLLIDVTGLAIIDSQVAAGLVRVAKAVRLLGAWVTLVGVRPEVAQAIVGLGIELGELRTASDLGSALARSQR